MDGPDLEIRLLGKLDVLRDGRSRQLPRSRKTRALLGYLAATGRAHSRAHLADLLWAGVSDPRAALRWSLSKLRRLLDDDVRRIVTERDTVALEPRGATVDLSELRAAVSPDPSDAPLDVLKAAAERFHGELLEGLELADHHRYHAWCLGERERVRRLRVSILAALTERLWDRPDEALTYVFARLAVDPYSEEAHAAAVRLLGALGRTHDALEHYERCRRVLRGEIGAWPSTDLERARRDLGGGADAAHTLAEPDPADAVERPSGPSAMEPGDDPTPSTRTPPVPPLVGRRTERETIEAFVEDARTGVTVPVLLFVGEPGIGKTRMLQEAAALTERAGGRVLVGRAFATEGLRPYGPWIDALRLLSLDDVPAGLRGDLAALLPELGPRSPELADRTQLFDGVVRLLASLATDTAPLLLRFDDVHWLDEASAALLHYVARARPSTRVLLACAARSVELEQNRTVARMVTALRAAGGLHTVPLRRLGLEDIGELVRQAGGAVEPARVFRESEGNPLFALEIARAVGGAGGNVPSTLEDRLRERLDGLSDGGRRLLPWAAALGRTFDAAVFARVGDRLSADPVEALEELSREGIVRAVGPDSFDFTHDLLRQVAYGRVPEPTKRLVHRRIARALDAMPRSERESVAEEVAHHALLGGEPELGVRACIEAGERCLAVFAFEEAAEFGGRGLRAVPDVPEPDRLSLHLELLKLYLHPGLGEHRPDGFEEEIARLIDEAIAADRSADARTGYYLLAILQYRRGDFAAAEASTSRAETASREADPATAARALGDAARCLALLERDLPRAEALVAEAERLAGQTGVEPVEIPSALGLLRQHAGELDDAALHFARALDLAEREQDHWWRCPCMSRLAMVEFERGRFVDALERCRAASSVARKMGEPSEAAFTDALAALARIRSGDEAAADALADHLEELRGLDSKWMIAYVQIAAAEFALERGEFAPARDRAEEALAAAATLGRPSLSAHARALAVRAALSAGEASAAAEHTDPVRSDAERAEHLSARSRRAVLAAADVLPTQITTD